MFLLNIIFGIVLCFCGVAHGDGDSWVQIQGPLNCEDMSIPKQKCIATGAKAFVEGESLLLKRKIRELTNQYPQFFRKLLQNKQKVLFFRHVSGVDTLGNRRFRRNPRIGAWVSPRDSSVHLTDRFFANPFRINEKHDYIDYALIHELSHVIDFDWGELSRQEEFLSIYQWERVPGGKPLQIAGVTFQTKRWQTMGVPFQKVDAVRQESAKLAQEGKGKAAEIMSLEFGQQHRHPGSYSMTHPTENFAEVIVGYFLDPVTLLTAPAALHSWLDSFFRTTD